jgi:hypothetical protein
MCLFPCPAKFLTSPGFSLFYDDAIGFVMPVLPAAAKAIYADGLASK